MAAAASPEGLSTWPCWSWARFGISGAYQHRRQRHVRFHLRLRCGCCYGYGRRVKSSGKKKGAMTLDLQQRLTSPPHRWDADSAHHRVHCLFGGQRRAPAWQSSSCAGWIPGLLWAGLCMLVAFLYGKKTSLRVSDKKAHRQSRIKDGLGRDPKPVLNCHHHRRHSVRLLHSYRGIRRRSCLRVFLIGGTV